MPISKTITLYHNPLCSKSRKVLKLLEDTGKRLRVIEYLEKAPSASTLYMVGKKLRLNPWHMIRRKEPLYLKLHKALDGAPKSQWFKVIAKNPELLERPIVVYGNKAVIARPPEKALDILS